MKRKGGAERKEIERHKIKRERTVQEGEGKEGGKEEGKKRKFIFIDIVHLQERYYRCCSAQAAARSTFHGIKVCSTFSQDAQPLV